MVRARFRAGVRVGAEQHSVGFENHFVSGGLWDSCFEEGV